MNDAGAIAGDFKGADGQFHGFIRTPWHGHAAHHMDDESPAAADQGDNR
jgi:hypothetical protein